MKPSIEVASTMSAQEIKRILADELGMTHTAAARRIRKSLSMVSMALNERAKSEVVLGRLTRLIERERNKRQLGHINAGPTIEQIA